MNIKMIVLDLDGTLLNSDKKISDKSKRVIQKCRENGIKVIFATVRGTVDENVIPAELFDGCVKKSGAAAYDGDKIIYSRTMRVDDVRGLLEACENTGIKVVVENNDDGTYHANFNDSEMWQDNKNYKFANFAEINFNADKIYAMPETLQEADIIKSNLPQGVYSFTCRNNITFIFHVDATKSKAAAALAAHWNIKREELLSFGDDLIDIDILEYCGVGVAMGNALDDVKAVADYVCDTNDNDGVAKWIEERIL
jgi:Cof subfamily protein (haloacid dehalogenase superfamily)